MQQRSLPLAFATLGIGTLVLSGCVANSTADSQTISVTSTETECKVSAASATSGTVVFEVANAGERTTEFYVLADDGLRIVGEVENIAPGSSRTLTVQLQPGNYFTTCKPGMIGAGVGQAEFSVSGEQVQLEGAEAEQHEAAIASYKAYVRDQVSQLQPLVKEFVDAYVSGDDARARELFATARVPYERIEPTAEAFGDLDPKIDYREVDAREEGLEWTGFHRIEKDLWPPAPGDKNSDDSDALAGWQPSTPEQRAEFGKQLIADVDRLAELVNSDDFELTLPDISNGAISLLDEVATGKITGEEDWWSHTDLSDFQANVQGAEVAFGIVRDIAIEKGEAELIEQIDAEFKALNSELAKYGSIEDGFMSYDKLSTEQVRALNDRVSALAEPLSQLTAVVLG